MMGMISDRLVCLLPDGDDSHFTVDTILAYSQKAGFYNGKWIMLPTQIHTT